MIPGTVYERRLRRLLRAYPPRYREVRGEELLATYLECSAPGQTRPTRAEIWDVLRGARRARLLDRPSFLHWLAYRLGEKRVPYECRYWVRDDVLGRFASQRAMIATNLPVQVILFFLPTVLNSVLDHRLHFQLGVPLPYLSYYLAFITVCILVPFPWANRIRRRRILQKHGFAEDGTSLDGLPPIEVTPQGWRYRA
ncbi:hypothetical protein GCM10027589_20570 [Actinocorallia lasiicapitis]